MQHRCLVPFTSFSEIDSRPGAPRNHLVWFALGPDRPLAFFAGVRTEWTSVRKLKEGEVTADLFGFLTCPPNAEVAPVHPKAMPVILTTAGRMAALADRPAATPCTCNALCRTACCTIVAEGVREDAA